MTERITNPGITADEAKADALLRPRRLDEFVGQTHWVAGVKNDADGRHVADISVRGARRDQQKIGSIEHVIALVGARGALAG